MSVSLEAARKNAGLTQAGFAKIVGVSEQTVNSWEKGKTVIDAISFKKLAVLSGFSSDDIDVPEKT